MSALATQRQARRKWDRPYLRATINHRGARDTSYDEIAVEYAVERGRMALTPPELLEAVRRLTGRGLSAHQIAERLGTTVRTVQRKRSRLRELNGECLD